MTSSGVTYRALTPQDYEVLYALVSDWAVVRNLGSWPWPPDPAFTRARCAPYAGDGFLWGICVDDALVGTVSVKGGVLGYMVHPDHQRKGIAGQAIQDALNCAFLQHDCAQVSADVWADNDVSRHVLQGFGFELQRQETVHALARDAETARETYVLSRSKWQALSDRP